MDMIETLIRTLEKIEAESQHGVPKPMRKALQAVFDLVGRFPLVLWDSPHATSLGKSLMLVVAYELYEEEEPLLQAAHLAYAYLRRGKDTAKDAEGVFEANKNLVVLLSELSDYLRHTVAMCYRGRNQHPSPEELTQSLSIANKRLPLLELMALEEIDNDLFEQRSDAYLIEREKFLAAEFQFVKEDVADAERLDAVMRRYIEHRMASGRLDF